MTVTVNVDQATVDLIQKYAGEYESSRDVLAYIIERNSTSAEVFKGETFKKFKQESQEAYVAFEGAKEAMLDEYVPDDVRKKLGSWNLDYRTAALTYEYED